MRSIVMCIAITSLLCQVTGAGEKESTPDAEALRLIEQLEKAGLKVTEGDEEKTDAQAALDEAKFRALLDKLAGPEISVDYTDASLDDVLADLQKLSNVNLLLDPKVSEERPEISVTMKLDKVKPISVLRNLLRMFDLVAVYADEALMVSLSSEEETVTLTYDVHELTETRDFPAFSRRLIRGLESRRRRHYFFDYNDDDYFDLREHGDLTPEPRLSSEELIDVLKEATPNGEWDDGPYSITYANGVLIVTHHPEMQVRVANIIMALKTRK